MMKKIQNNSLKQKVIVIVFLLMGVMNGMAENYPYRSDYLWVTVPDHPNWIYKTGEKAIVEVQFYKYGIPRDGTVSYTIGNDMLPDDDKGTVMLENGRANNKIGKNRNPGLLDVRISNTNTG